MSIHLNVLLIVAALVCGMTAPAWAAQAQYTEEVLVTGSRLSQPSARADVFVIDDQVIANQSPVSVLQALQYTPGLYVSQPGGRGGVASVSMRGAESNFTVVLIDGVQVNDPTNTRGGSFNFSMVDINEVHQIEILRSTASSVYGSDALSGVISIVTYDPEQRNIELSLTAGEDDLQQLGIRTTLESESFGVLHLAASTSEENNTSAGAEFSSDNIRVNYDKRWQANSFAARFSAAQSDQGGFPEDSGGQEFAVLRVTDERQSDGFSAAFGHRAALSDDVTLFTDASYYDYEEDFLSPGIAGGARNPFGVPANGSDSSFKRTKFSTFAEYQHSAVDLVVGAQWQLEDGVADGQVDTIGPTFFALERATVSGFVELFSQLTEDTYVGGGLRVDRPEKEASQTTFRGSINHDFSSRLSAFARAGSGFKLPSFFALGNSLVGNPNLKPERVKSYEVGLQGQATDRLGLELVGFRSVYEDLIDFDPEQFTNINQSKVTTAGLDLTILGRGLDDRLDFRLFLSYVDIDLQGGGRLRQRPQWRIGALINYQPTERFSLNLGWQRNDQRFDSSIPNPSVTLDSYGLLDLALHAEVRPGLRLTAALDNLTDENYFDADGFAAPGRRARVGVKLTW